VDGNFIMLEDFNYEYGINGILYRLTVPKGFVFDGTSVPRITWTISGITPGGPEIPASAVHDMLYVTKGKVNNTMELGHTHFFKKDARDSWQVVANSVWTRKQSDKIFARILGEIGVPKKRRRLMYRAVRFFGWIPWRKPIRLTLIG
jgi:hypothetical protein